MKKINININITLTKETTYIDVEDSGGAKYSTREFTPQEAFNDYIGDYLTVFLEPKPFIYEGVYGLVQIVDVAEVSGQFYFIDTAWRTVFSIPITETNKDYTLEEFAEIFGV